MRVSPRGVVEIAEHEGIVPAPYKDSVGVWTFGVGHTAAAGGPDPAQMKKGMPENVPAAVTKALHVFSMDLAEYERRVNEAIDVPLSQHEFDALVSFDFNTGGIYRAKLTEAINRRDPTAARHFMGWLRPPEIRGRRTDEQRLFETGNYDANGNKVAIWRVDERGRRRGIISHMEGPDLLARMGRKPEKPHWLTALIEALLGLFTKEAKP